MHRTHELNTNERANMEATKTKTDGETALDEARRMASESARRLGYVQGINAALAVMRAHKAISLDTRIDIGAECAQLAVNA